MNEDLKHQLHLTTAIQDVVDFLDGCDSPEPSACNQLIEALQSFGLPQENQMILLLKRLRTDLSVWEKFKGLYHQWIDTRMIAMANATRVSPSHKTGRLGCDRKFNQLMSTIKISKASDLIAQAMDCLRKIKDESPSLYELLTVGYRGWYFENNWLDGVDGSNNSLIDNRINALKNNADKIEWLYDHLEDNLSKMSLNALMVSWLTFSMQEALELSTYSTQIGVANPDIFPFYEDEVFVDCGSYIGDTVAEFVNIVNRSYKHIHTYDISASTVEQMKNNLRGLDRITYNVKGVSSKQGELNLSGVDAPFHGNRLVEGKGICKVPVVALDEDIHGEVTFLKIDVEGLDKEALRGARALIARHHPRIHVDTYHKLVDFFEVPLLIHSIDPTYRFYLRLHNALSKQTMFAISSIYAL